jgi:hypothetical protein
MSKLTESLFDWYKRKANRPDFGLTGFLESMRFETVFNFEKRSVYTDLSTYFLLTIS